MKFSSKILVAVLAIHASIAFAQNNADTIFYGGPIVTVNAKNEEVEALAVKDGKIVAVGSKSEVTKGWQASTTKIVNLQGKTVMPGLIDPHIHIILTAVGEYIWLDLSNFTTKYDTVASLSNKLKAHLKNVHSQKTSTSLFLGLILDIFFNPCNVVTGVLPFKLTSKNFMIV